MTDAVNKSLDDVIKESKKTNKKAPGTQKKIKKTARPNRGEANRNPRKKAVTATRAIRKTGSKTAGGQRRVGNNRPRSGSASQPQQPKKTITTVQKATPSERNTLKISNLDFKITHQDLLELFSKYGKVTRNHIDFDELGRSKGTAFITYEKKESAMKAIDEYNGAQLDGKVITVEFDKKGSSMVKKTIKKIERPSQNSNRREDRRRDDRRDNRRDDRNWNDRRRDDKRRDNRRQGGGRRDFGGNRRNDRRDGGFRNKNNRGRNNNRRGGRRNNN